MVSWMAIRKIQRNVPVKLFLVTNGASHFILFYYMNFNKNISRSSNIFSILLILMYIIILKWNQVLEVTKCQNCYKSNWDNNITLYLCIYNNSDLSIYCICLKGQQINQMFWVGNAMMLNWPIYPTDSLVSYTHIK